MIQIKHILDKCEKELADKDTAFLIEFISLKILSEIFELERNEIRNNFLINGICRKEVDGLIEEYRYYKSIYIPVNARWSTIEPHERNLIVQIVQVMKGILPDSKVDVDSWGIDDVAIKAIYRIVDLYDFMALNTIQRQYEITQLVDWITKRAIESKRVPIFLKLQNILNNY